MGCPVSRSDAGSSEFISSAGSYKVKLLEPESGRPADGSEPPGACMATGESIQVPIIPKSESVTFTAVGPREEGKTDKKRDKILHFERPSTVIA